MAVLNRMDWYDLARTTNWTPTYVTEDELFPPPLAGAFGLPQNAWEKYDEPYKQTYPEYVKVQRDKDAGAYSVKAALERLAAAQRLLSIDGFARSIDLTGGMPTAARQKRINAFDADFDSTIYSAAAQRRSSSTRGTSRPSRRTASSTTITQLWPPDAATMTLFNATSAELSARGFQGIPAFKAMCMLAFQVARTKASHVVSFDGDTALGGTTYDTHSNNVVGQLNAGKRYFGPIAQLLSALKATPSPIVSGKTIEYTYKSVIGLTEYFFK